MRFSPSLADKLAIDTNTANADEIAIMLLREVRPDIDNLQPRARLEALASGQELRALESEIESTREALALAKEELAEYRCPYCGAPLSDRFLAPIDAEGRDFSFRESFECGFRRFDREIERPCPADPLFPKFEDYELDFRQTETGWECFPRGTTEMARRLLPFWLSVGKTKQEAERYFREHYEQLAKRYW